MHTFITGSKCYSESERQSEPLPYRLAGNAEAVLFINKLGVFSVNDTNPLIVASVHLSQR